MKYEAVTGHYINQNTKGGACIKITVEITYIIVMFAIASPQLEAMYSYDKSVYI